MTGLVLSLFPGIGLLDMAFEQVGFCVVRGPDILWGGNIVEFKPPKGRFDGVIGGPPCQFASRLRHVNANKNVTPAVNLIPEFERVVVESRPAWFVMENVPEAPLPVVPDYFLSEALIRDHWCGGETMRMRRFSFGSLVDLRFRVETLALHRTDPRPAALASGGNRPGLDLRTHPQKLGNMGFKTAAVFREHLELQGLPKDFLGDAPFTVEGKIRAVGNGVPLAMGRAVANAVREAVSP